jgi:hypothetical protein
MLLGPDQESLKFRPVQTSNLITPASQHACHRCNELHLVSPLLKTLPKSRVWPNKISKVLAYPNVNEICFLGTDFAIWPRCSFIAEATLVAG